MIKRRNEVIAERPVRRVRSMPSEARFARERCAGRHQPEWGEWTKRIIESVSERGEVLACLCSVETVCAIRGGESCGKHDGLCATATPALLAAANNEWSHLGIWCADQRGDAERSADLGGAHNKMRSSGRAGVQLVVVCRLHRVDYECSAAGCAPSGGERRPRLDGADLA
jgi:hypothetical protein